MRKMRLHVPVCSEAPILRGKWPALAVEEQAIVTAVGLRVLVVDDEAQLRRLMAEALAMRGIWAQTAAPGSEAIETLARVPVSVLVLDVGTRGMSGFDLWTRVKRMNPELARRTVFCTGELMVEAVRTFVDSTGCLYLGKPFKWSDFFDAVGEAASR